MSAGPQFPLAAAFAAEFLAGLAGHPIASGHRLLLWVEGSAAQCRSAAIGVLEKSARAGDAAIYLHGAQNSSADVLPNLSCEVSEVRSDSEAQHLLGSETALIVFDAHTGFDPNRFAIAAGSLLGGGALVLLTPPAEQWARSSDAQLARMLPAAGPFSDVAPGYSLYLKRAGNILHAASDRGDILRLDSRRLEEIAHCAEPREAAPPSQLNLDSRPRSSGALSPGAAQREVVAALSALMDHKCGTVLVCAQRGRGKTTALGFALQRWLQHPQAAAPQRALLVGTPRHLRPLQAVIERLGLNPGHPQLFFAAPDQALLSAADSEYTDQQTLLVVDEAAALALPVLRALCTRFPRHLLATTTSGYEGSGSGFATLLTQQFARWAYFLKQLSMHAPMRWPQGDLLESLADRLLCNSAPPGLPGSDADTPRADQLDKLLIRETTAAELAGDEVLLAQCYALLAEAHYQTEPRDLRLLLDAPYARLWLAVVDDVVVGALLALEEGGLAVDSPLATDILNGSRRPRGNLVAQLLAVHSGEPAWMCGRSLRIARIAVRPELRRQGVATRLHDALRAATTCSHAFISSSFAFNSELCSYWRGRAMCPVHLGMRLDKASGARSIVVVETFDPFLQRQQARLAGQLDADLDYWLPRFVPELHARERQALRKFCTVGDRHQAACAASDRDKLAGFRDAVLDIAAVLPAIERALRAVTQSEATDSEAIRRLQSCTSLAPDWAALCAKFGCPGRRELQRVMRADTGLLLAMLHKSSA